MLLKTGAIAILIAKPLSGEISYVLRRNSNCRTHMRRISMNKQLVNNGLIINDLLFPDGLKILS